MQQTDIIRKFFIHFWPNDEINNFFPQVIIKFRDSFQSDW